MADTSSDRHADDVRAKFAHVEGSMSEDLMTERRAEANRSAENDRPDAGVRCPKDKSGDHVLRYAEGDWYCWRCFATLRLGVWYAPGSPELNDGLEGG